MGDNAIDKKKVCGGRGRPTAQSRPKSSVGTNSTAPKVWRLMFKYIPLQQTSVLSPVASTEDVSK